MAIDANNIQGDILVGIPKKTQTYFFFQIQGNAVNFRKALVKIVPFIKSATQVQADRKALQEHKSKGDGTLLPMTGTQIAFSHIGLDKMGVLGVNSSILPFGPFLAGQFKDAQSLGDAGSFEGLSFVPDWDPAFGDQNIDGLIFTGGDSQESVDQELNSIKQILGDTVKQIIQIAGNTRPGENSGHEHFGFLDGISNPAIEGFDTNPLPGPKSVNQSVILTGKNLFPLPVLVDGSFLVFRYLHQLVPEFNDWLRFHPIKAQGLTPEQGSELMGARMVGRWKSGAPIDISPNKDDPELAKDPQRNNDFSYGGERIQGTQLHCPFSAHTRKTNPRGDFTERGLPLDNRRIMRRGIQFGPEVTDEEASSNKTAQERGLLFVCYQSDISAGFQFIQRTWSNDPLFVDGARAGLLPMLPGLDPIIGQDKDKDRNSAGLDPANPTGTISIPRFVVPRGGEYLFSPSISALRDIIAAK